MKRILLMIFTLAPYLSVDAFFYRPELDGDGGLFFITGENAVSGIAIFIGCIALFLICSKVGNLIDGDGESHGIRKTVSNFLCIVGILACTAAIGMAFALWWITLIVLIIIVIGAALYERIKEEYSIKSKEDTTKDYNKLIPLSSFENFHGALEIGCVVNNYNGDRFDICRCTDHKGFILYIGFSPYLGKLSYHRVATIKDRLYIICNADGCYFLCTKESEKRWDTDTDEESQMCHYLEYGGMLSILKELNVEGKAGDYTFTNEKDF